MKQWFNRRTGRFIFAAAGLLAIALLYWALLTAMPKYAGRVPFLIVLLVIDWLIFNAISSNWRNSSGIIRKIIIIFWWAPIVLLLLFLIGSIFWPLQDWNNWLRIYVPGLALIAFLSKFFLFIGLLPAFLLQFISFLYNIGKKNPHPLFRIPVRILKNISILLGIIVLALLLTGSIYWVYRFKVHEVPVTIKDLPPQFEGLRIVQLSDIHLGSWVSTKPLQRAVDQVNALKPDLIVFTGDIVNYSTDEVNGFESTLSQLKAPMGIYAILGNHDYGDYTSWVSDSAKMQNMIDLELFYKNIGWKLLRNQSDLIFVDSASLLLAGVENWSATSRFRKYGDMKTTLDGYPEGDLNILLSHDPTHWDAEVTGVYPQFDLTLSGHTHGMQMGIETAGIKWSPAQYIYKEWAGLYPYKTTSGEINHLYVNRGLGHIGYPGRVGILPEITLIILKREL